MQCGTSDHRNFAVSYHAGHVVETLGMSWNEQQKCVPVQLFQYVKNPRFFTVACTGAHEYGAVADGSISNLTLPVTAILPAPNCPSLSASVSVWAATTEKPRAASFMMDRIFLPFFNDRSDRRALTRASFT